LKKRLSWWFAGSFPPGILAKVWLELVRDSEGPEKWCFFGPQLAGVITFS